MTRIYWTVCIVVVLWIGGAIPGAAQSPEDVYFHKAAKEYVAGNTEAALRTVEQGLKVTPSNPRLMALREKLQTRRSGKGRNEGSSSSAETGASSRPNGASNESSRTDDPSGNAEAGTKENDARRSNSPPSGQGSSEPSVAQPAEVERDGARPGLHGAGSPVDTLSRLQAERLLRALEGQERQLLQQLQIRSAEPQTVEKDW